MDGINLFQQFVALHKAQLESSGVPQYMWQALHRKLENETFDAGEAFQLLLIEYEEDEDKNEDYDEMQVKQKLNGTDADNYLMEEVRPVFSLGVARQSGIKIRDPTAIFLIDHAWTFRLNTARQQLQQHAQLTDRLCAITGVDLEDEERVDKLLCSIWRYCNAYSIATEGLSAEERMPIWYIMDEVGSAIQHSDDPNFRLVPFLYLNTQTTFSLLFPLRDCEYGEQVTRDFVEQVNKEAPERAALLLPWRASDLRKESFLQTEPDATYFSSGHIPETYPQVKDLLSVPTVQRNAPLKVYAEYDVIRRHLTSEWFQLVDREEDANVLWLTQHFKNFRELAEFTPQKFVNQFPFEYVLTIKDLLSTVGRRVAGEHHNADTLETYPSWLPTTYNLKTELLQFASYYQHRAAKGLDNHWIIKPWNLARGLDTHVTNNLAQIMRLPATGPKIAQKYIDHPVLFQRSDLDARVKFDVRYIILLKSVKPLEAYVHRKFFLRFANRAFSLDNYDDYEKHFTVMNYQEEAELHHIKCADFLIYWAQQYPLHSWNNVEDNICTMLYELLISATNCEPPCGIPPCAQSRAVYAADIMLEWCRAGAEDNGTIQPKLLEVNWAPDCKRACDYYPEFLNDIFELLFLDKSNEESFRLLGEKK